MMKTVATGNEKSHSKRILYVDSGIDKRGMKIIANALLELGEVTLMYGLSEKTIEIVQAALKDQPFDAMVTHLPVLSEETSSLVTGMEYCSALSLVKKIRKLSRMPIIVYTGAGEGAISDLLWDRSGADTLIEKSDHREEDGRKLISNIQYEWHRSPLEPERLKIESINNGTALQMVTVLQQRNGLRPALVHRVVEIFRNIPGRIEKVSDGVAEAESPLDNMIYMMMLFAKYGSHLRIRVQSTEPKAEHALREAHQLFNQEYLD